MSLPNIVLAGITNRAVDPSLQSISGTQALSTFISLGISLIVIFGGLFFFFMLVLGGFKWITSGGDKGQVQSARDQVTHALIGLIVMFSAWAIARLIESIFGINIINIDLGPVLLRG